MKAGTRHSIISLALIVLAGALLAPQPGCAGTVTLAWDPAPQPELDGYWIYYGNKPGRYSEKLDVGKTTSCTVSGLPAGTYYFSVKAYGSSGEQSFYSDEVTAVVTEKPGEANPPEISSIEVTEVTSKSAVISWRTDRYSDSEVAYREPAGEPRRSALRLLEKQHSLTLNGLKPGTTYFFRVKSRDAGGREAVSVELQFTTPAGGSVSLVSPRSARGGIGPDTIVGIALTNLGDGPAPVKTTTMEDDGRLTSEAGIRNPSTGAIGADSQLTSTDWQLYGGDIFSMSSNGWNRHEAASARVGGLYQIYDLGLTAMDGANLHDAPMADLAFTALEANGYNEATLINDNPLDAVVAFDLVGPDGTIRATQMQRIKSRGSLTANLFGGVFRGIRPGSGDYVRVRSPRALHAFQVTRQPGTDFALLAAQDLTTGGTTLYAPQFVLGGGYRTALSVVNLDAAAGTVTVRFVDENGIQLGIARTVALAPRGKLYVDDPGFFDLTPGGAARAGYLEVVSNGIRVTGNAIISDVNGRTFSAALALVSEPQTSALFGLVVSNETYFTGLALLNPNAADASVQIEFRAPDGSLIVSKTERLPARRRSARFLETYFPSLANARPAQGYIRLTADRPIVPFALIGTRNLLVLSAVPPLAPE